MFAFEPLAEGAAREDDRGEPGSRDIAGAIADVDDEVAEVAEGAGIGEFEPLLEFDAAGAVVTNAPAVGEPGAPAVADQPVEAVGEICAEAEVPYLVDACQAAGQIPFDVGRLRCDFLAATARKFLRGPRGVGFLYVSDRILESGAHPLFIDMRGAEWTVPDAYRPAEDARRFENWEFAYALVLGLGAAARYALGVGVAEAGRRARALARRLRARLAATDGLRVLDRGPELCAIVTVEVRGRDARAVVAELRRRGIHASATCRAWALLDMQEKGAETAVRLSPHYYNTEEEVDAAAEALAELA